MDAENLREKQRALAAFIKDPTSRAWGEGAA